MQSIITQPTEGVGSAQNLNLSLMPRGIGNVGVGNPPPLNRLDVMSGVRIGVHSTSRPLYVTGEIGQTSAGAEIMHNNGTAGIGIGWGGMYAVGSTADLDVAVMPKGTGKVTVGPAGGTTTQLVVNGPITSTMGIAATYQDIAEWVPASSDMTPGTVVVLNRDRNNEVMRSSHAYDTAVAGVVSSQPGIILGVQAEAKERIATTGRVRVHVDATQYPVRVGDLLVTADRPGMAMRSQPLDFGGVEMHRPGTLIGKALEPLASGEGEILVPLSLQ